ncbi:FAD-binding and (Fe-S)-binding domain-containing protein [Arthrobacter crystallopoietes]|uniref:FAD/FMN-containing dehydrogenase n=1 Tax=Crystallibacter crystallopoietes TaxID=37928 RepID=A0A1H1CX59_9MICC|nr:FAD-binding and (Fe-S)-binding domain-containing protein [Arthrobacter crystallopoietes]AUI50562.1 FAD-binding oxidoreductase [Arthrobacter crystallopoietes]SDQ68825.1 FAD/FMN-containing dehydrogenase [Arthrobacter crystallopoietes]
MTQDVLSAPERAPILARLEAAGVPAEISGHRIAEYSYDASNYRVPPLGVVFPRSVHDVVAVVTACRETGTPLIGRGGGTSMAGNAIGPGIVLDFSRHMNRILSVDEGAKTADVEAGVILSHLTREAEDATGGALTFAPDPSSKTRATIGGAIGNDACGNHSVRYGRTSDHVVEIDVVTSDGARLTATSTGLRATDPADAYSVSRAFDLGEDLKQLAGDNLAAFRTELGRIQRQVSGYHLANLLPENGLNVARALVGTEGTCALVVRARMKLVPKAPSALLVCLGYADVVDAAKDIETILEFSPAAVEGIDEAIVDTMRLRRGADSVLGLPEGKAFLYVDLDGENPEKVAREADRLLERLAANGRLVDGRAVPDLVQRATLWRVREDGAGLSSRPASGGESQAGWEDSAVAPENLAAYLADFRRLLEVHGLTGIMYGHFGAGCMHIRITYDLRCEDGRAVYRKFTQAAAELVVRHGGSLSGEHGDGRARSEFLPVMYSPAMIAAFETYRNLWDKAGIMNPGSITDPDPIDTNLALEGVPDREWRTHFELRPVEAAAAGADKWVHAVQACIGVGRCRSDAGGVMCPSFRATGDEKDSTRGRSRVLQDMVRGAGSIDEGWKSEDVREALDLCLACKACSNDCPAGVDMATYKSEFFSHYYDGKIRPLSHFSLGWLPRWLKLTTRISPIVNAVLSSPLAKVVAAAGGLTTKRAMPKFASRKMLRDALAGFGNNNGTGDTVLFVDSFTKGFRPEVAGAAARVIEGTGRQVSCESDACCGLTWISTGQLDTAKKMMAKTVAKLDDGTDAPIVVVEPSCAAALRKDAPELLGTEAAERVSHRIQSFAEAVKGWVAEGWQPPAVPESVTVQTHCHEYSTFGATVQRKALAALGVADVTEATGCCGVAGNFGFEANHYDISMKVAEQALAPALASTPESTPVLADGFSCAMQVRQLDPERKSLHLAELLDPQTTTHHTEGQS